MNHINRAKATENLIFFNSIHQEFQENMYFVYF